MRYESYKNEHNYNVTKIKTNYNINSNSKLQLQRPASAGLNYRQKRIKNNHNISSKRQEYIKNVGYDDTKYSYTYDLTTNEDYENTTTRNI